MRVMEFNIKDIVAKKPIEPINNSGDKLEIETNNFSKVLENVNETPKNNENSEKVVVENDNFLGNVEKVVENINIEGLNEESLIQLLLAIGNYLVQNNPIEDTNINLEENLVVPIEIESNIENMDLNTEISNLVKVLNNNIVEENPEIKDLFSQLFTSNELIPKEEENKVVKLVMDLLQGEKIQTVFENKDLGELNKAIGEVISTIKDEIKGKTPEKSNILNELVERIKNSINKESLIVKEPLVSNEKVEFKPIENTVLVEKNPEIIKEEEVLNKILDEENNNLNKFSMLSGKLQTKVVETKVEAPTPINKGTMVQDVVKNIRYIEKNNIQQLTVKIYPKELGEVTIKILSEDGIMKAELKSTSKETYNILNSNLQDIKKGLSEQGIKIQDVNIGLYNEDATFFAGENSKDNNFNKENRGYGSEKNSKEELLTDDLEAVSTLEEGSFLNREV